MAGEKPSIKTKAEVIEVEFDEHVSRHSSKRVSVADHGSIFPVTPANHDGCPTKLDSKSVAIAQLKTNMNAKICDLPKKRDPEENEVAADTAADTALVTSKLSTIPARQGWAALPEGSLKVTLPDLQAFFRKHNPDKEASAAGLLQK